MVDSDVVCKIILRAPDFREVLADLDSTSDFVEFSLSPTSPYFRITTEGLAGKFQVKSELYPSEALLVTHISTCINSVLDRHSEE